MKRSEKLIQFVFRNKKQYSDYTINNWGYTIKQQPLQDLLKPVQPLSWQRNPLVYLL